jgi:hypothetical protein
MALWGEAAFGMGNQGLPGIMSVYEDYQAWFTSPTHRVGTTPWRHPSPGGAGGL